MEEAGHRGWRNTNAPVGTILLLMCMIVPTLAYLQPSESPTCPPEDYISEKGICCNKCFPGYKLVEECNATGHRSTCAPCPEKQFRDKINSFHQCDACRVCQAQKKEKTLQKCERHQNTICQCFDGYYRFYHDSASYECRKCAQCKPDEKEKEICTNLSNTVCECKENYYRVKNKCEPCKRREKLGVKNWATAIVTEYNKRPVVQYMDSWAPVFNDCTSECNHGCSLPCVIPKDDSTQEQFFKNIIAGVVAVAVVLLALVALITHVVTKRSWAEPSSQPTDDSPDPSEVVLISSEGCSENSIVEVTPISPVSEQLPPKLPDCVPLEFETSHLIYSVLDLVSALQVKQLVRLLGVRDTEIEQAELDHRPCREAHYQMLRLWAERVSRVDGGGRSGMLHRPLLHELLDKLKTMRLGGVAEELETKYSIQ